MTRLGATTNPLPSSTFWQLVATPRIFSTLGRVAATTGSAASAASGTSTLTIGVRPNGCSTSGSPEVLSSDDSRVGTRLQPGRRDVVDRRQHARTTHGRGEIGLIRGRERGGEQPRRHQHRDELQRRRRRPSRTVRSAAVADGAAHAPGRAPRPRSRRSRRARGSGTAPRTAWSAARRVCPTTCGRQQHTRHRAEDDPDEGQQRAKRPGTPAGDGGDEGDGEDGQIKPLRRCHCWPSR